MNASDQALVFGRHPDPGLVAVEHVPAAGGDRMVLFRRTGDRVAAEEVPFRPFLWLESAATLDGCAAPRETASLAGDGALRALARFPTWRALDQALAWLRKTTGLGAGDARAPYFALQDPVQQFLLDTGRTLFHGLSFGGLRRMQLDIETQTEEGYEFSNPDREGDQIGRAHV